MISTYDKYLGRYITSDRASANDILNEERDESTYIITKAIASELNKLDNGTFDPMEFKKKALRTISKMAKSFRDNRMDIHELLLTKIYIQEDLKDARKIMLNVKQLHPKVYRSVDGDEIIKEMESIIFLNIQ